MQENKRWGTSSVQRITSSGLCWDLRCLVSSGCKVLRGNSGLAGSHEDVFVMLGIPPSPFPCWVDWLGLCFSFSFSIPGSFQGSSSVVLIPLAGVIASCLVLSSPSLIMVVVLVMVCRGRGLQKSWDPISCIIESGPDIHIVFRNPAQHPNIFQVLLLVYWCHYVKSPHWTVFVTGDEFTDTWIDHLLLEREIGEMNNVFKGPAIARFLDLVLCSSNFLFAYKVLTSHLSIKSRASYHISKLGFWSSQVGNSEKRRHPLFLGRTYKVREAEFLEGMAGLSGMIMILPDSLWFCLFLWSSH